MNKTEKQIKKDANKYLKTFCKKLHEPKDLRKVWEDLENMGVDVPTISGHPHTVSETGMKGWMLEYKINGQVQDDSYFCYNVAEETGHPTKNEYLIYLS